MPRRWAWRLLDIAALICLGQAAMLAQREPDDMTRAVAAAFPLAPAEQDFGRYGTRIYETPRSLVVALSVPELPGKARVSVTGGLIRVEDRFWRRSEPIPVPAGADQRRYVVKRVADELRVVFARLTP